MIGHGGSKKVITRLTDFKRGPTMLVMETRRDHNHNQRHNHPEVDRLPNGAIFSKTGPINGAMQRLYVVPLSAGNELLLYAGHPEEPAHHPQPKGCRLVLIPTVLHDTP